MQDTVLVHLKLEAGVSMQNMRKHSCWGALVLVIALWWATPIPVTATPFNPAVEYATSSFGGGVGCCGPFTLGYEFSTSVPFNVNALAYWADGQLKNRQVGIWDSGASLLVSTTVLNTDPIQGHFQYHTIPLVTLGPGTYRIGGEYLGDLYPYNTVGVVTVPGFTWIKDEQVAGAGLNYPTFTTNGVGYGPYGILIPNFSIATAVPESSTLILLAAGLAGILGYGWRRKRVA